MQGMHLGIHTELHLRCGLEHSHGIDFCQQLGAPLSALLHRQSCGHIRFQAINLHAEFLDDFVDERRELAMQGRDRCAGPHVAGRPERNQNADRGPEQSVNPQVVSSALCTSQPMITMLPATL